MSKLPGVAGSLVVIDLHSEVRHGAGKVQSIPAGFVASFPL